ncbi:hypothetical protein EMGBS6_15520 [Opitutia bacterium]|nr:hypothetical protein EMGBS6_15520 [Opitutae bacterium]
MDLEAEETLAVAEGTERPRHRPRAGRHGSRDAGGRGTKLQSNARRKNLRDQIESGCAPASRLRRSVTGPSLISRNGGSGRRPSIDIGPTSTRATAGLDGAEQGLHELHQLGVGQAVALAAGLESRRSWRGHHRRAKGGRKSRLRGGPSRPANRATKARRPQVRAMQARPGCARKLRPYSSKSKPAEASSGSRSLSTAAGSGFEFDAQRHEHRLADGLLRGELGEDGFVEYALVASPRYRGSRARWASRRTARSSRRRESRRQPRRTAGA